MGSFNPASLSTDCMSRIPVCKNRTKFIFIFIKKQGTWKFHHKIYPSTTNNKDKINSIFFCFLIMLKDPWRAFVISFLYRCEGNRCYFDFCFLTLIQSNLFGTDYRRSDSTGLLALFEGIYGSLNDWGASLQGRLCWSWKGKVRWSIAMVSCGYRKCMYFTLQSKVLSLSLHVFCFVLFFPCF